MTSNNIRLLTRREAADFLTSRGFVTSRATLEKLACLGRGGPTYAKFGSRCVYREVDLLAWAEARMRVVQAA